eukprot:Selendium_serpulae@DN4970_c0_g1_i11.p2
MPSSSDEEKKGPAPPDDTVTIKCIRARGLRDADMGKGHSDPYLQIKHRTVKYMGKTVKDDLDPVFVETIHLPYNKTKDGKVIKLEIYDEDHGRPDDALGHLEIDVERDAVGNEVTLPLLGKKAKKGSCIVIQINKKAGWEKQVIHWNKDPVATAVLEKREAEVKAAMKAKKAAEPKKERRGSKASSKSSKSGG